MKVLSAAKGRKPAKGREQRASTEMYATPAIEMTLFARVIHPNFKYWDGSGNPLGISSADGIAVFSL